MKAIAISAGLLAASGLILLSEASAQAASFSSFSFTTHKTGSNPRGDIRLDSVTVGGSTISNFSLVSHAEIIANPEFSGGNTGAASSDRGDQTHRDSLVEQGPIAEDPTNADVVASLGNLNLNSIIDTEDGGAATVDVFFDQPLSHFFFWERGKNSDLTVQALDRDRGLLASFKILREMWNDAGFKINTKEITDNQVVGSFGLKLEGATASILRLISTNESNGPDYKVVGEELQSVPEPATLAGIGVTAATLALVRRRKATKQA
jgi:hypothetical protein